MILCHFEEDRCEWAIASTGEYSWKNKNAKILSDLDYGPDGDIHQNDTLFFMIAAGKYALSADPSAQTKLVSPSFDKGDHPFECFEFWYQFGVSFRQ